MTVQSPDNSERPMGIVKSWIGWFGRGMPWYSTLPVLGLLGLVGWKIGWSRLPTFGLILLTLVFTYGQFGPLYAQARIAQIWRHMLLPPPMPTAPPLRLLRWTGAAAVALTVASMAACRWVLGAGWDAVPLLDRYSPWTVLILAAGSLIPAEILVAYRVRREIRQRCQAELDEESALVDEQSRSQS